MKALYDYSQAFSGKNAAETFRSLYKDYTYTEVKKSNDTYVLNKNKTPKPILEYFNFSGNSIATEEWINRSDTSGLIIFANNQIQYEYYGNGNIDTTRHLLASCSKSIASALVGIALEKGYIKDINDQVTDYVPKLKNTGFEGVTIKHTLQMSTGIKWSEDYSDLSSEVAKSIAGVITGSQDEFAATMVNEKKPGTFHNYCTINTHVLGMVLRNATGKTYQEFLEKELWSKMGTESSAILFTDTKGEPVVYGGIYAVLRDMLRFGILYYNNGVNFKGKQLIPSDWIKASVTPDASHLMPMENNPNSSSPLGYGYQWWIPLDWEEDYSAMGIFGQFIYVNQKYNVVIAKTSAYKDYLKSKDTMQKETFAAFKALAKYYGNTNNSLE